MPSATIRHLTGFRPAVGLAFPPSYRPNDVLIGPWSWAAIGDELTGISTGNAASATYPAASRVLAFPFEIADYHLVRKVWWMNGTTATTDSADVGVYSEDGVTLLVHGGSTAIAGANIIQEADPADTLIPPGRYWCNYVQGGVTATPTAFTASVATLRSAGCAQMAGSGSTLGSTFTPAAIASTVFPLFGIAARTQVA